MKNLVFSICLISVFSCGSENLNSTNVKNETENVTEPTIALPVESTMELYLEESTIKWDRVLDQKATKKKVKLFGAMVDVDLGPVELTMNGDVSPTKGILNFVDNDPSNGNVTFDMATFKFAEEKGQGLFNTEEFPESELTFNSFEKIENDSINNYNVSMSLTIQDHTEEFSSPMNVSNQKLDGSFLINTLDFPLRDNAKKSEVNKDEIDVTLNLTWK